MAEKIRRYDVSLALQMSDVLVKRLRRRWPNEDPKTKAEKKEAADLIEELEAKLEKAMQHVADYSNDPYLVEWANATLAELRSVSSANTKGDTE